MPDATLITRHLGIPPRINQHDENSLWDPTNQLQKNRKSFGQRDKKMEETTTMKQPSYCTIFVHYSESIHKKRFSGGETGTGDVYECYIFKLYSLTNLVMEKEKEKKLNDVTEAMSFDNDFSKMKEMSFSHVSGSLEDGQIRDS
ncbi:hypothetical protein TNCV_5095481 [Trichonephila clavipes]|nr:hypothetical protein TNCV_5095481 [Trichonephila clavipes]